MKRMLLAVFSALYMSAFAQITITAATFPAAGDTLRVAVDNAPGNLDLAPMPGVSNHTWDFTSLTASATDEYVYQNAVMGMDVASFPGSDLVVFGQNGETYFNKTATKFEVMGYSGGDPGSGFNVDVVAKFAPSIVERRAPLNFFDINQQTYSLNVAFGAEGLPDTLLAGLPIQLDSIRFKVTTQQLDVVDGWGTCKIPGGQYPVLRQKRTEYSQTGIELKPVFPPIWIDLSTLIGGGGGGQFGNLLGADTTVSYYFLSGVEKEEIAVVTLDNNQSDIVSVRYKNNGQMTPTWEFGTPGSASIQAFPNPAIDWVRFDCANLPSDDYTLKIYNIIGKVVWKETYPIAGNKSIRIELDNFKKGTYLYSLVDSKGTIISTKRLVILKP